jgi:predicted small integral membrane protein
VFFLVIGALLAAMGVWEWRSPGGAPRRGVLGLVTTRGDRLFLSLVGTAYIHLGWLGLFDGALWGATLLSAVYAFAVFRWV